MNPLTLKANQVSSADGSGEWGGWDAPAHFPCLFLTLGIPHTNPTEPRELLRPLN